MANGKKNCRLNRSEAFVLAGVLSKHDTKKMRWHEIEKLACEALGKRLGEDISRESIKGVMEDAKLPTPERSHLRESNASRLDRTSAVARYVRALYEKLNEPVPQGLMDLCSRNSIVRGEEQEPVSPEENKPATQSLT